MNDLEKHLTGHTQDYAMTGTTRWFGVGNDIDYLVPTDTVPPELLTPENVTTHDEDYAEAPENGSYTIRVGECNYILKPKLEYNDWLRATKEMSRIVKNMPDLAVAIKEDRELRVGMFKLLRKNRDRPTL